MNTALDLFWTILLALVVIIIVAGCIGTPNDNDQ